MKKVLSIILAFAMCIAFTATVFANLNFTDVTTDDWFYNDVKTAVELGLINGKTETEFKPDDLLTYAEAVKLAACMNQLYLNGAITLTNGEPWYKPYADYCSANEITAKDYNYDLNATRAGYMEIFAKALPDEALKAINNIPDGRIPDVNIDAPYADSVYKLYRAGIVTGVDALHNCKPNDYIRRCEVATIIARMMDESKRVKFDVAINVIKNNDEIINVEVDEENKAQTIVLTPTDEPVINDSDITIKENESTVIVTPTENPQIEIGESPTLPGTQLGDVTVEVVPGGNVDVGESPTLPGTQLGDVTVEVVPGGNIDVSDNNLILSPLTIHKQPEGLEADSYGVKTELEVQVFGGKAPYTYEWYYYTGYRNEKAKIENGDYTEGADSATLVLSVEKENTLLGEGIFCKITDAEGTVVTSDTVKFYGPFSMPVDTDTVNVANKEYTLAGRISDGTIKKGDKVSVERNGKIIAIGTATDLQMFNKSLDEGVKNDNIGIILELEDGVRPISGDTVIKYKNTHVIDTSDVIN